jgi:hypothetical protein
MAKASLTPVGSEADSPAIDSIATRAYTRAGAPLLHGPHLEAIRKFRTPISESLQSCFCNGNQVGNVT